MSEHGIDYETIRRRVRRMLIKRIVFFANLALFLIGFWANRYNRDIVPSAIAWLIVLLIHYFWTFDIWGRLVDHFTRREVDRMRRRGYTVEAFEEAANYKPKYRHYVKPKRGQRLRLSDDGELVYEDDETGRHVDRRGRQR